MISFAQKISLSFPTTHHMLKGCDIYKTAYRKNGGGGNIILHILELPDKNVRFYCVSFILLNGGYSHDTLMTAPDKITQQFHLLN